MKRVLVVWGNWGPYHYARFQAFHDQGGETGLRVQGVELFPRSGYYDWNAHLDHPDIHHLNLGSIETEFNPWRIATRLFPLLWKLRPHVIFVPSYWHWSLAINAAGRALGARIVMMNESHAGTERARGIARTLKKQIVRRFDSALVGGNPHRRHFSRLGLDPLRIRLGYDAVDNDYFAAQSDQARAEAETWRASLELPPHYFLSLGRMVKKKNLATLIQAYALAVRRNSGLPQDLVFVGSGDEENSLRALCRQLKIKTLDHEQSPSRRAGFVRGEHVAATAGYSMASTASRDPWLEARTPCVHFYGFRQVHENPAFYGLASAFILPSITEEWGLVVNEAMASKLPVVVSKTAGCAEDLVRHGRNGFQFNPRSAEELASHLEALADPSLSAAMGEEARKVIQDWGCDRFAKGAVAAAHAALAHHNRNVERGVQLKDLSREP